MAQQLRGWRSLGGTPEWDALDHDDSSNSGSARVAAASAGIPRGIESECVSVAEGERYDLSAWGIQTSTGELGEFTLILAWYGEVGCDPDSKVEVATFSAVFDANDWVLVDGAATAPVGSRGVRVEVMSSSSQTMLVTHFDAIELVPEPGSGLLVVAALGTLGALRRRAQVA